MGTRVPPRRKRRSLRALLRVVIVSGVLCPPVHGQAPRSSDQKPVMFDVVSITPHKTFERGGTLRFQSGGRFQGTNVYVLALVATAFGDGRALLPARIEGGPGWIRADRFDIAAKTDAVIEDVTTLYRQLPAMLRPVLEDRFHLKTHWETRALQVFVLALARKDGGLGPRLHRSNCTPRPETIRTEATPSEPSEGRPLCDVAFGVGTIDGSGLSMLSLAGALSTGLDRVVLDRTGLEGIYDVSLHWSPDFAQRDGDANAPSLAAALQEQLGLTLQSTTAPIDVLVIDHIERPTPN